MAADGSGLVDAEFAQLRVLSGFTYHDRAVAQDVRGVSRLVDADNADLLGVEFRDRGGKGRQGVDMALQALADNVDKVARWRFPVGPKPAILHSDEDPAAERVGKRGRGLSDLEARALCHVLLELDEERLALADIARRSSSSSSPSARWRKPGPDT